MVTQTQSVSVHMTTVNLDGDPDSNPDLTLHVLTLSQGTTAVVVTMFTLFGEQTQTVTYPV